MAQIAGLRPDHSYSYVVFRGVQAISERKTLRTLPLPKLPSDARREWGIRQSALKGLGSPVSSVLTSDYGRDYFAWIYFQHGLVKYARLNPDGVVPGRAVIRDPLLYVRYNQCRQLSSHNSYDKLGLGWYLQSHIGNLSVGLPYGIAVSTKGPLADQLKAGTRSFEFDLQVEHHYNFLNPVDWGDLGDANPGWSVYHSTSWLSGGDYCESLGGCLGPLLRWHNDHPDHEVITLWLELKFDWEGGGHKPKDLDAALSNILRDRSSHESLIYTPMDLLRDHRGAATLQECVTGWRGAWPTVRNLAGKFIVVLHGETNHLQDYLRDVNYYREISNAQYPGPKNCFVAPEISAGVEIDTWGNSDETGSTIFFNVKTDNTEACVVAWFRNFVSRVYKIDDQSQWSTARTRLAHHLATDHVTGDLFQPPAVDRNGVPLEPFYTPYS